jgi:hypothetical protein
MAFSGLPKPEAEEPYLRKVYDVVIHCGLNPAPAFDYLVAGIRAHQRVAAYDSALDAYDLVVSPPAGAGIAGFLEQVVHYLKIISPAHVNNPS